ncbi:MAG: hypothetical protein IIV64_00590, partial [Muribaculaceae bacterium]|nr:hypothetical protein [Muribaculaceae bacterium]
MEIGYATFSEVGRRFENQDVLKVIQMPKANRALMVVCDGMGATEKELSVKSVCCEVTPYGTILLLLEDSRFET